jgi:hypothetical protein
MLGFMAVMVPLVFVINDYSTYFLMLYIFNCWDVSTPAAAAHSESLFQTG